MTSSSQPLSDEQLEQLVGLLEERLAVISDYALREKDPDEQLRRLEAASESIATFHAENRGAIPPRLEHFLANSSLEKALAWAKETLADEA